MANAKTTEAYTSMTAQLEKANAYRKSLQEMQTDIDEKIEDVTRVILGLERMVGALRPAIGAEQVGVWDEMAKATVHELEMTA